MIKVLDETGLSALITKIKNTFATKTELNGKQATLTFDNSPTENSNNPVKSSGVYTALQGKQSVIETAISLLTDDTRYKHIKLDPEYSSESTSEDAVWQYNRGQGYIKLNNGIIIQFGPICRGNRVKIPSSTTQPLDYDDPVNLPNKTMFPISFTQYVAAIGVSQIETYYTNVWGSAGTESDPNLCPININNAHSDLDGFWAVTTRTNIPVGSYIAIGK